MLHQQILLIRHAESDKNLQENFDGDPDLDRLTPNGREKVAKISKALRKSASKPMRIFSADSGRARETSEILQGNAKEEIAFMAAFGSMGSGPFGGMDDHALSVSFPDFFQDLQLFRAGVLSGYKMRTPDGAERWKDFEGKISDALDQVFRDEADTKIIVCHRSAMIALLAYFSRIIFDYPSSYLGFANVPPLFSALIRPDNSDAPYIVGDCIDLVGQFDQ